MIKIIKRQIENDRFKTHKYFVKTKPYTVSLDIQYGCHDILFKNELKIKPIF